MMEAPVYRPCSSLKVQQSNLLTNATIIVKPQFLKILLAALLDYEEVKIVKNIKITFYFYKIRNEIHSLLC